MAFPHRTVKGNPPDALLDISGTRVTRVLSFLFEMLLQVLLPLGALAAAGGLWPRFYSREAAAALRVQLSQLALNVFVPALVFSIVAEAKLSPALLTIPLLLAGSMVTVGALLYGVLYRSPLGAGLADRTRAALLLCGMFGNVFYIGYPVSLFLYGPEGGRYPAFADLLASTPLVWTLGVWIAARLSGREESDRMPVWRVMLGLPPVWAFAAGAAVNLAGWEVGSLAKAARFVGQPTIPVMMVVLGLTIPWRDLRPSRPILATAAVKLVLMPLLAWVAAQVFFSPVGEAQRAAVVEAAMPTMLVAILFADRFGLDGEAAALMIGWTTILFWLTMPMWIAIMGA